MMKIRFAMKNQKQFSFILALVLAGCVLVGCSGVMGQQSGGIPSDLRNSTWTRQIDGQETVTISFGTNRMTLSSDGNSAQNDQEWIYRGEYCCGYGYCGFYYGDYSLDFRYVCRNNTLTINRCNVQSLNGNWTKK